MTNTPSEIHEAEAPFRPVAAEDEKSIKRGRPRKTNRQGRDTIEEITQAAMRILAAEGSSHLTFDRIAKEASITKGTLVYHFRTKEVLLEHLMEVYKERLAKRLRIGRMEAEISGSSIPDPTVAGFFEWYRTFRAEGQGNTAFGLSVLGLSAKNETMRSILQTWYEDLFSELRRSPCGVDGLIAVLAIEGLFYLRHFRMDRLHDEDVESVLKTLASRCRSAAHAAAD